MKEIDVLVGKRIRELRHIAGAPQAEVAKAIKVTYQQLQKYETAANRISAGKLGVLSQYFGVPISYFYNEENTDLATDEDLRRMLSTWRHLKEVDKKVLVEMAASLKEARIRLSA